jgi:hypothetical protein
MKQLRLNDIWKVNDRLLYLKLDLREILPKEVSSLIGFSSIRICKDILGEELHEAVKVK